MSNQRSGVDEDDDFDDLDDVLDQFSGPAPQPAPPAHAASTSESARRPAQPEPGALSDEFAAELARELLEELAAPGAGAKSNASPGAGETTDADAERRLMEEQLAAAWEAMLIEGMNAMDPSGSGSASSSSPKPAATDYQSRIRSTMDRLREHESELHPADSAATAGDTSLDPLLSQLSEGELQEMLEAAMRQLMGKDVLYEPLKELYEKFPGYLTEHAATISSEDRTRYEAQIACIKRLIDAFEATSYRDDDERSREKIVELMGELQTHGKPPDEIMGPLPPGFSMGADGLPEIPEGCNMN